MKILNRLTIITLSALSLLNLTGCAEEKSAEAKLISFNILTTYREDGRWEERKAGIVNMLGQERPDVMGLQEATDIQVEWFDSLLGATYSRVGVGRNEDRTGEHTAVYYVRERYDLLAGDTFWLSETPDVPSKSWDARFPRIVTWVQLKDKTTGKEMWVFNTHFDHKGVEARVEASKLIVAKIKELAGDKATVFVMGDLNIKPDNQALVPLTEYMTQARTASPQTDTCNSFHGFGKKSSTIDYIFMRNATPVSFATMTDGYGIDYLSDHYPIMATVNY